MDNHEKFVWYLKYQPQTIDECALPNRIKNSFHKFVEGGEIPNLLLFGPPGTGKTTIAQAAIRALGRDVLFINGSLDRGIDMLRNDVSEFASALSLEGERKYVIIDEADGLNILTQKALRGLMEQFSGSCGFILTCNYPNQIIEPIRDSRLIEIDFHYSKSELKEVIPPLFKILLNILDTEKVPYDKEVMKEVVKTMLPDMRRMLNKLQKFANDHNEINTGILTALDDKLIEGLITLVKERRFDDMRQWVAENGDLEFRHLIERLYAEVSKQVVPESVPVLIYQLNEADKTFVHASSKEIHLIAMLMQIMGECEFK
ncbi:DNA polymerase sliding clamp loader subunit [Ochrobactrum phage vB_OspM_OC]|nr:DNA polymerase sliding clamp loader subunit [Ochrobactrum phage vB_OspM_OC]